MTIANKDFGAQIPSPSLNENINYDSDIISFFLDRPILKWVGGVLSVVLFITVIAFAYFLGVKDVQNGAIPIIVSDGTPIKVKPENPGGKKFPHQDISIYQNLRGNNKNDLVLSQAPEKPNEYSPAEKVALDRAAIISSSVDDGALTSVTLSDKPKINADKKEVQFSSFLEEKKSKLNLDNKNEEKVITKKEKQYLEPIPLNPEQKRDTQILSLIKTKKPIEKKKVEKVIKEKKPTIYSSNKPYLQIGAYRSHLDASNAWKKISNKYGYLLGVNDHLIVKADIKNKGTYYRLRVGPYNSKQAALNSCNNLKSKAQACMFVMQ